MTIAIKTLPVRIRSQRSKLSIPGVVVLKRLWWHTTAFTPIVGILLLILGSLLFLQMHWLYQNLVSPFSFKKTN